MSMWDEGNLRYLLFLLNTQKIRGIDELSSLVFLMNYYGLLYSGKTFFSYKFVKSKNFIEALGLKEDLKDIIVSNLATYLSSGVFAITTLGKKILTEFGIVEPLFENIILTLSEEDSKKRVSEFIFIQKMNDKEEIIL